MHFNFKTTKVSILYVFLFRRRFRPLLAVARDRRDTFHKPPRRDAMSVARARRPAVSVDDVPIGSRRVRAVVVVGSNRGRQTTTRRRCLTVFLLKIIRHRNFIAVYDEVVACGAQRRTFASNDFHNLDTRNELLFSFIFLLIFWFETSDLDFEIRNVL